MREVEANDNLHFRSLGEADRSKITMTEVLRQEIFQCLLEFIHKYVLKTFTRCS